MPNQPLDVLIDVAASLAACGRQNAGGAVKVWEDLSRYEHVLAHSRPQMLVECGTWMGGSARWFAAHGLGVVTVDVDRHGYEPHPSIIWLRGSSTDPHTVATAAKAAAGLRTMVVLDSDHGREHVAAEIQAYGPLVSEGCYLVVEDGIVAFQEQHPWVGSPLDAIADQLAGHRARWRRDTHVEAMHPVSMSPAGWWIRTGEPWD